MVVARTERLSYRHPDAPRPALDGVDLELRGGRARAARGRQRLGQDDAAARALRPRPALPRRHDARALPRRRPRHAQRLAGRICRRAGLVFQDPEAGAVMLSVDREVAFPLENAACPRGDPGDGRAGARGRGRAPAGRAAARDALGRGAAARHARHRTRTVAAAAAARRADLPARPGRRPTRWRAHLRRLCDETGTAAIVADHRTERLAAVADRVIVLERGRIVADGRPDAVVLPPRSPPPLADRPVPAGAPLASSRSRRRLRHVPSCCGRRLVLRQAP